MRNFELAICCTSQLICSVNTGNLETEKFNQISKDGILKAFNDLIYTTEMIVVGELFNCVFIFH